MGLSAWAFSRLSMRVGRYSFLEGQNAEYLARSGNFQMTKASMTTMSMSGITKRR